MILGPSLLFCPADRPERYAKALAAAGPNILTTLTLPVTDPWRRSAFVHNSTP